MEKKRGKPLRRAVIVLAAAVLAAALALLAFTLIQSLQAASLAEETVGTYLLPVRASEEIDEDTSGGEEAGSFNAGDDEFRVDWDALLAVNPDVCAWIRVPAIPAISYPVIHYTDNQTYLRRSWKGDYLAAGCIMADCCCARDFSDFHTIVYGHNMTTGPDAGTMFGQLKKFQDPAFYFENDDRIFIYIPEQTLIYKIFSVHVVDPDDPAVYLVGGFTEEQAEDFAKGLVRMADYDTGVEVSGDDRILTLSTCSGSTSSRRLVVHGKLMMTEDPL